MHLLCVEGYTFRVQTTIELFPATNHVTSSELELELKSVDLVKARPSCLSAPSSTDILLFEWLALPFLPLPPTTTPQPLPPSARLGGGAGSFTRVLEAGKGLI